MGCLWRTAEDGFLDLDIIPVNAACSAKMLTISGSFSELVVVGFHKFHKLVKLMKGDVKISAEETVGVWSSPKNVLIQDQKRTATIARYELNRYTRHWYQAKTPEVFQSDIASLIAPVLHAINEPYSRDKGYALDIAAVEMHGGEILGAFATDGHQLVSSSDPKITTGIETFQIHREIARHLHKVIPGVVRVLYFSEGDGVPSSVRLEKYDAVSGEGISLEIARTSGASVEYDIRPAPWRMVIPQKDDDIQSKITISKKDIQEALKYTAQFSGKVTNAVRIIADQVRQEITFFAESPDGEGDGSYTVKGLVEVGHFVIDINKKYLQNVVRLAKDDLTISFRDVDSPVVLKTKTFPGTIFIIMPTQELDTSDGIGRIPRADSMGPDFRGTILGKYKVSSTQYVVARLGRSPTGQVWEFLEFIDFYDSVDACEKAIVNIMNASEEAPF